MKKPPKPSHRDVYAVGDERNRVKIGVSNNAGNRILNLQTGTADKLRMIHVENVEYELGTKVERRALQILGEQGKDGVREWRNNVSDEEARNSIQTAYEIERGNNQEQYDLFRKRLK